MKQKRKVRQTLLRNWKRDGKKSKTKKLMNVKDDTVQAEFFNSGKTPPKEKIKTFISIKANITINM